MGNSVLKILITILLMSYSFMCNANPKIEKTINDARWQKRIILLFENSDSSAQKQLNQWRNVDFDEWDIVTINISKDDAQLIEKYQVNETKTLSILIGKDGTEKWRSNKLVDFSVLEALIEKMPMHKNEKL